ncbi:TIR-only protein [Linum grandiflorum]
MQRATTAIAKASTKILRSAPNVDVFINHRGIDTKRTISGLLYDRLASPGLQLSPFLDSKNMKPGDRLFDNINAAIRGCKVGVAVFSPRYCDSYFCLHELAMLMESKKRVIPIFCDVKPSELRVPNKGECSMEEMRRFSYALEEAKDWSDFMRKATDAVLKNLIEVDGETFGYTYENAKYTVQKAMKYRSR